MSDPVGGSGPGKAAPLTYKKFAQFFAKINFVETCAHCGAMPLYPRSGEGMSCPDCYDGAPDSETRNDCVRWQGNGPDTIKAWNALQEELASADELIERIAFLEGERTVGPMQGYSLERQDRIQVEYEKLLDDAKKRGLKP